MVGRVVGSYRIVEKIGEGGMGAVYRAVDEMLDREVAIKAIRPDLAREPQIVERFRAEAKILARVHHPAIATIYSFFYDTGELFLAMEFVPGRTLAEVLAAEGAIPWPRAVALFATALEGIEQAHRAGIIHRDLKPDNLMLTPTGALKVMDFGIARMTGSNHLTQTGLLVGTLRYMAPEQIRGEEVDRRTDVYALGSVLYQMVTGRVPFDAPSDFAILKAQLDDPPPAPASLVPDLPAWLNGAILKALEKDPASRFQTVEEMRAFLTGQGTTAPAPAPAKAEDELPTMVLPARPPSSPGAPAVPAAASPATVETDRPRLPLPPPPLPTLPPLPPPVARPAASSPSYRPVGGSSRAPWIAAAAAVLVLAVLAFAGWRFLRPSPAAEETPAQVAVTPAPEPAAAVQPSAALTPPPQTQTEQVPEPTPLAPSPFPAPRREPAAVPRPAPETRPEPSTAPAVQPEEPKPAEPHPVPAQATDDPVTEAPSSVAGELPYDDLHQVTEALVANSEKLGELYGEFLDKKEDGGAELTEADDQLKDELEALAEAAGNLNKRTKEGFFTRGRLRNPGNRLEVLKRARELADSAGRVERLMATVQPGPEVRQEWQEVKRGWKSVVRMVGGR